MSEIAFAAKAFVIGRTLPAVNYYYRNYSGGKALRRHNVLGKGNWLAVEVAAARSPPRPVIAS